MKKKKETLLTGAKAILVAEIVYLIMPAIVTVFLSTKNYGVKVEVTSIFLAFLLGRELSAFAFKRIFFKKEKKDVK